MVQTELEIVRSFSDLKVSKIGYIAVNATCCAVKFAEPDAKTSHKQLI